MELTFRDVHALPTTSLHAEDHLRRDWHIWERALVEQHILLERWLEKQDVRLLIVVTQPFSLSLSF